MVLHGAEADDAVENGQNYQHIKEIEITQGGEGSHGNQKMALFFVEYTLYAEEEQGEVDHGIDKVGVHGSQDDGVAAKDIEKASCKDGRSLPLHAEAVAGKGDAGKVEAKEDQKIVESLQKPDGHQEGQKIQGISDHIVMKGGENIGAIADGGIPQGNGQAMFCDKGAQNGKAPVAEVDQGIKVLGKAVGLPDQGFPVPPKG